LSRTNKILSTIAAAVAVALAFAFGQVNVASDSVRFDLGAIGRSIYEAHARSGKWPARIEDLADTEYLKMPYRRMELERGIFVVVWQDDLAADPSMNRDRVLAYHDSGLLARFGRTWVLRGNLRTEYMDRDDLSALVREH
jgi:hypothetical protein